jgi:hypothetical protein
VRVLLICLLLAGCAHNPTTFYLSKPARPILPTIDATALECLSDNTYKAIVMRDAMRRWYAQELEAIIDSTRQVKK